MKSILLAGLLGFCVTTISAFGEFGTGVQRFGDEYYAFVVPDEMVEAAPKWKDSEAIPPLLPRDASKAAVLRLVETFALIPRWKVKAITLKRIFPDNWIYLVEASDQTSSVYEIPWSLTVPVLLDGKTVPTILVSPDDPEVKDFRAKEKVP